MQQVPDTMPCEVLADVHVVTTRHFLDHSPDLVYCHSWLTNRNSFVHGLLGDLCHLQLDRLFRLPVEDCQVIISMIAIYISRDINVNFVTQV